MTKAGGSIATAGSVTRLFHRKGLMMVSREGVNEDALMEVALEAGAEDFKAEAEGFVVLTDPGHFEAVHKAIEAKGFKCASASVTHLATLSVPLADAEAGTAVSKLIEQLEDHDDVKEVYSNAEFAAG